MTRWPGGQCPPGSEATPEEGTEGPNTWVLGSTEQGRGLLTEAKPEGFQLQSGTEEFAASSMYPQPRPKAGKDTSCKIKNTFLEFSNPEENEGTSVNKRRTRSDVDKRHSPLVLAKSPTASPVLQPVDETMLAIPIDEVNFELLEEAADDRGEPSGPSRSRIHSYEGGWTAEAAGMGREEPAYVVPTTPSPFLHSSFPPSVVPPFGAYGYGMGDMGLPPAFGDADCAYMQGMGFMPDAAFDATGHFGGYLPFWAMGMDADMAQTEEVREQQNLMLQQAACMEEQNLMLLQQQHMQQLEAEATKAQERRQRPSAEGSPQQKHQNEKAPGSSDRSKHKEPTPQKDHQAYSEQAWAQPEKEKARRNGGAGAAAGWERPAAEVRDDRQSAGKDSRKGKGRSREGDERAAEPSDRPAKGAEKEERRTERAGASERGNGDRRGNDRSQAEGAAGKAAAAMDEGFDEIPADFTTVMLRNIPNKYTREMLIKQLSVDYAGEFDFMYLPIDFKNKCNVGYGFINFRNPAVCARFVANFHGVDVRKCLPGLNSKKIVEVTPARVQGLSENVRRLRNSPVMNQLVDHPEWMPLLFKDNGEDDPFPSPDAPLPPMKPRGRNREATRE